MLIIHGFCKCLSQSWIVIIVHWRAIHWPILLLFLLIHFLHVRVFRHILHTRMVCLCLDDRLIKVSRGYHHGMSLILNNGFKCLLRTIWVCGCCCLYPNSIRVTTIGCYRCVLGSIKDNSGLIKTKSTKRWLRSPDKLLRVIFVRTTSADWLLHIRTVVTNYWLGVPECSSWCLLT